ncbi:MAG: CHAT domain-containing protein [Dokdonia sp.]|jgi:CHAT domain-containing protein
MIFILKVIKKNHLSYFKKLRWVIFLFYTITIAQNTTKLQSIINSEIDNTQKSQQLDSLFTTWEEQNKDSLYVDYHTTAFWYYKQNNLEKAISYQKKSFNNSITRTKDSVFAQKSSLFLSFYYNLNYQYKNAIDSYNTIINFEIDNKNTNQAFSGIAYTYNKIKDFHKADLYYKALLEKLEAKQPSSFIVDMYYRTAYNLMEFNTKKHFIEGVTYAKKGDNLLSKIETSTVIKYRIKSCLAALYNKSETLDINLSQQYYEEALQLAKELQDTTRIRNMYIELGNLHQTTDLNKALSYDKKALSITSKKDSLAYHMITGNISFAYGYFGNYSESIQYAQQALQSITQENFNDHTQDYREVFLASSYKQNLLTQLSTLAQTYLRYYEETKDPLLLEKCIAYFTMGDQLIDLLKVDSSEFTSRLFWRNLSTSIYGKAIRACYLNKNIEQAHYFIEKNKALLLMEDLASQAYKRSLTISPDLIAQEQTLQRDIFAQEQLLRTRTETLDTSTTSTLYRTLVDKKRALEQLRNDVLPEKQISFEPTILSLEEVQGSLAENEVMINYHISNDNGYGLYSNNNRGYLLITTKEKNDFFEIEDTNILETNIQTLLTYLKRPFKTQEDIDKYTTLSYTIYKTVFPTEELRGDIKNKKLIISPDSYLSFLPFEALSTTSDTTSYFIHDAEIRYVYSNSFIKNIARETTKQKHTYLGMAPVHFKDTQLASLDYSLQEINSIGSYYSGDTLLEDKGTKQAFLDALGQHTIIHLATHADISDTTSPWIAFRDEKITLEELYLTENNASLVFLSGCNTTLGENEAGEGVMSLARGFFYAGAESVISTLWSIDDKSTAYITDGFYSNLSKGQTTSKALYNSKHSYLQQHSGSEASPYYWASTILLGNNNITSTPSYTLYIWIVLIVLFLIGFYYIRHYVYTKRKHEK